MAKGLRSSAKKVNKQKLRSSVFGPVETARKERLSAKLMQLASKRSKGYEEAGKGSEDVQRSNETETHFDTRNKELEMDVDESIEATSSASNHQKLNRVQKKGRSRARAAMVFPVYRQGRRVGPHLSARQRKQSLKPH